MKWILLDLDGVLITRQSWAEHKGTDPNCVDALNTVTDQTGAKIVICSTWRLDTTIPEFRALFTRWGVRGDVVDRTPRIPTFERGLEIQHWLRYNASPMDPFVIFDDSEDMGPLTPRVIKPSKEHGLTFSEAHAAIRLLQLPGISPAAGLAAALRPL